MTVTDKYKIVNIRRYIDNQELGEEVLLQILSEFSCSQNQDVERFLKKNAIEFTKKNQSVTYLVFSVEDKELLGYFSLAIKPLTVKGETVSRFGKAVCIMFGGRFRYEAKNTDNGDNGDNGIKKLREAIKEADAIVIGAGAGLSTSAGFIYTGERFHKYFQDFIDKYGFRDMYSGGFYPFDSLEEHWAYWSRYIYINRYMNPPKDVYHKLYELVKARDYQIITTNVDHCFQKAGFDKQRLYYTQGDFGLFQCSEPCHDKTYDNAETVREMVLAQGFQIAEDGTLVAPPDVTLKMRVLPELIPLCPVCRKPMSMNLRADDTFVQDEGWYQAAERYKDFLEKHRQANVLFLELGTGMNTPSIVKFSFWNMVQQWEKATYVCVNLKEAFAPDEIWDKSICINGDIGCVLEKLV